MIQRSQGSSRPEREDIDEEALLRALRKGDLAAYETLWVHHVRSALTFAHQIAPGNAEDLVSEAFTSVLRAITVSGKGPTDGFRAYLFTTMRNTAARWSKEGSRNLTVSNPEDFEVLLTQEDTSADTTEEYAALVRAFRNLPDRWRNVLWLAEVEETPRQEIAEQLALKPNAVSALLRRARAGLRMHWLAELLPGSLRDDRHHMAALLPHYIVGKLSVRKRGDVKDHLGACQTCSQAKSDLQAAWACMSNETLRTLGLGALGATLLDVGTSAGSKAGTAVAATLVGGGSGGASSSLIGGASISSALKVASAAAAAALLAHLAVSNLDLWDTPSHTSAASVDVGGGAPSELDEAFAGLDQTPLTPLPPFSPPESEVFNETETTKESPDALNEPEPTGRLSGTEWVPFLDVTSAGGEQLVRPPRPEPIPPGSYQPPTDSEEPDAEDALLAPPALSATPNATEYIAPLLMGSALPGSTVLLEPKSARLGAQQDGSTPGNPGYTPAGEAFAVEADESGTWSFDLSTLQLAADEYVVRIWQSSDGQVSQALETQFFLHGPGFTLPYHSTLEQVAAELDGLPVDFNGPSNATLCLVTDTEQRFDIPLDDGGIARRFLRFVGAGDYHLTFMICAGERLGPEFAAEVTVVADGIVGFGGFMLTDDRTVLLGTE